MGILSKVGDFFFPSSSVGAARRKDTFGTESKAVAGTVIAAAAVGAIAAPYAVAARGGVVPVLSGIGKKIAGSSLKTKFFLGVATAPVVGAVVSEPKNITRVAGGVVNLQSNLYEFGKNPNLETGKDIFKENPILAGGALAGLIGGTGAGTWLLTKQNTDAVNRNTEATLSGLIPNDNNKNDKEKTVDYDGGDSFITSPNFPDKSSPSSPQSEPLTPETMVLGREVKTGVVVPRRRKVNKPRAQNVRVSVLNQNTYIDNK